MRARFGRLDREFWWLLILVIVIGNVIRGAEGWWIGALAFMAGAAYRTRFPAKVASTTRHEQGEGLPSMRGSLEPRPRTPPPYPWEGKS